MLKTPATEKQQGMLAFQLRSSHDGAFNQNYLDRHIVDELKQMNELGMIDKLDASDLISALRDYNNDRTNPSMIALTDKILLHMRNRIKQELPLESRGA